MKDHEKEDEETIMDGWQELWKGKYVVSWCHLCDTAMILCPECHNISCNGGGCPACLADYEEWKKVKHHVRDYLSPDEAKSYAKGLSLHRLIKESIRKGQNEIDWHKMNEEGYLSEKDQETFASFLV